jgi:hypothetical protein
MKPEGRLIPIALILLATALHAAICWRLCIGPGSFAEDDFVPVHDHPYVAVNATIAAQSLRETGTTAGYDPSFMGGYAHSFISDSNPVAPLFALIVGEDRGGLAYKIHAAVMLGLIPLTSALGARWLGLSWRATALGTWLLAGTFWFVRFNFYLRYGMVAFLASPGWLLMLIGATAAWLREPTWPRTMGLGVVAGLSLFVHTTVGPTLFPPLALALLTVRGTEVIRLLPKLVCAGLLALAINAPWLAPLPTVWPTVGETPTFFVNENLTERIVELVRNPEDTLGVSILLAFGGMLGAGRRLGRAGGLILGWSIAWLAFLAYPAGLFRAFDVLQPGRNTLHLHVILTMLAGGLVDLGWRRGLVVIAVQSLVAAALFSIPLRHAAGLVPLIVQNLRTGATVLPARTAENHRVLAVRIRRAFPEARRIFFEDRSVGVEGVDDPFADFRPSPVLPKLTGKELIGGPFPKTHYTTAGVNVVDGMFFGQPFERQRFLERAVAFGVDGFVAWSPPALAFAREHPDLLDPAEADARSPLALFRIRRPPARWERLGVTIEARLNEIRVNIPAGVIEPVTIPYHHVPGLVIAEGTGRLSSTPVPGERTPQITIEGGSGSIVIRYRPLAGWLGNP